MPPLGSMELKSFFGKFGEAVQGKEDKHEDVYEPRILEHAEVFMQGEDAVRARKRRNRSVRINSVEDIPNIVTQYARIRAMSEDQIPEGPSDEEVIALARDAVEAARQDANGQDNVAAQDQPRGGITIDLRHRDLKRIPDEVVDIIKDGLERCGKVPLQRLFGLALAHNWLESLPLRLAECTRLRYLNLRYNEIHIFPAAVLELTTLEILDLRMNKIRHIPEEISNLTSLKFLVLEKNKIERVPLCVGDLKNLQLLKLSQNPLKFPPPKVFEITEDDKQLPERERERLITTNVKTFLRETSERQRPRAEAETDSSESNVETPRPQRTRTGGRFPVKPSISSMEAFADPKSGSSPGNPPPIPTRSHYRVQSQQTASTRRPPITPLAIANERNRSHSEGAGSANIRAKRMGMVTRKTSDLARVEESSLRAAGHLRVNSSDSLSKVQADKTNVHANTGDAPRQKSLFMRPLSDVIEHKPWSDDYDKVVNSFRMSVTLTVDFLLPVENLLRAANIPSHHALMNCFDQTQHVLKVVGGLLRRYDALAEEEEDLADQLFGQLLQDSARLIDSHIELTALLNESFEEISRYCDDPGVKRIFQRLVNAQYMSAVDARNASASLGMVFNEHNDEMNRDKHRSDRSTTPTQNWPNPDIRTAIPNQYDGSTSIPNTPRNYNGTPPLSTSNTLRANTISSSLAATPRSGESFATIGTVSMSRSNTMQNVDESDEEGLFEGIWQKLSNACQLTLQTLPSCHQKFIEAYTVATRDPEPTRTSVQRWSRVIEKSSAVHQAAAQLHQTLKSIKLRDAEFRSSQQFWQMCTTYVKSWSDLASAVKEIGQLGHIPDDIKSVMKPIQRAVKDASVSITTSPWSHLAVRGDNTTSYAQSYHSVHPSDASSNSLSSGSTYNSNGYVASHYANNSGYTTVPATPLSAALGAAAQATVPSTPGHAPTVSNDGPLTGAFSGNVFERADHYLRQTRRRI
ncbi:hypothetical protein K490DRAFT_67212 [Saccharata proteae CBS 121410]|uniref:Disease resistance R13L4/SHOC-2-like LRR domain-containing protein n=1 Tax=Saccharata proteae CBS 121410 TaxID=1314787 RepID=A0A9P4HVC3_9PEZI|nr:hypothetical protein K490DRAFT_67212 [Saccharata proteae CBS 121410]